MPRDHLMHRFRDGGGQRMLPGGERDQLAAQALRCGVGGQAGAEQGYGFGGARDVSVRQGHDPGSDVAHGGHPEHAAQFRRTAPGVEGRDDVDGVAGEAGKLGRDGPERGAAAEKKHARPGFRLKHDGLPPGQGSGRAGNPPYP